MKVLRVRVLAPILVVAALTVTLILMINDDERDVSELGPKSDPIVVESTTEHQDLLLILSMPKARWSASEEILVEATLKNTGDESISLQYPSSQRFDLAIVGAGDQEVFRWSKGQVFRQVLGEVTLKPGESISENLMWVITDNDGTSTRYSGTYILIVESSANTLKGVRVEHDISLE